jgi:anaerobic magnesium-protoporphyrin IX monomethyl ester cyclase
MNILFVVKNTDYFEPLGLMSVSAIARRDGHTCHLGIAEKQDIFGLIRRIQPGVVAYSATTGEHNYYAELNKRVKEFFPGVFTILGGPHATFCPSLIWETTFDALCVGEGEDAFRELLKSVATGRPFCDISNIITVSDPAARVRDLIADLDVLPFPDRALLYEHTELGRGPLKSFITSRGCPYSCAYCFNRAFRELYNGKGSAVRRHSVDYMIDEIREVKRAYRLEFVKFYDDIFALSADRWLQEFSEKFPKKVGLPFHCLTRADLLTPDIAALLKQAGCRSVSMSIESGNPRIREKVLDRQMDDRRIIQAFATCRAHGMHTFSNNILGLPTSSLEDDIRTLDLNIACRVSFAEFPIFQPFPGTRLGDQCVNDGLFDADYGAMHTSYMHTSLLKCFSRRQKACQTNFSLLAPVALLFPRLRGLIVKFLIFLPLHPLYLLMYYFSKAYMLRVRIYPVRMSMVGKIGMAFKSFRLEVCKHSSEKRRKGAIDG